MKLGPCLPRSLGPHLRPILALLPWIREATINLWRKEMGIYSTEHLPYHMPGSVLSALCTEQIISILLKIEDGRS